MTIKRELSCRQRRIIAFLWLAILATLLLRESLLPQYTLLPLDLIQTIAPWDDRDFGPLENGLISDPFYSFYPRRALLTDAIRNGEFPLWNPTILSGTPNTANPNYQLFYPPNLLAALVLPADQALPWLAWLHLVLAGALMYLFLHQHKLHWLASLAGATVWMLNGYIIVWLENPHRLSTLAWMPGIFLAYETAVSRKSIAWAAIGGIMLGLSILGGQMQFIFAFGFMLGVYGLMVIAERFYQNHAWKDAGRAIMYMATIGFIGLGIGSLILLPANEFAEMSQRVHYSSETIQRTRWPLLHLVTLFSPDFYGNPVSEQAYWSTNNYAEMSAYFGVVAFFLALTAPFVAAAKRFSRYTYVMASIVFALILGTPLARLLFALPGAEFIVLTRLLFLVPLTGSWLTAVSLDGWFKQSASRRRQIVSILFAITVTFTLVVWTIINLGDEFALHQAAIMVELGRSVLLITVVILLLLLIPRWPKITSALILLLITADIFALGKAFNPITPTDYLYPDNAITTYLQQDTDLYRVLPLQTNKVLFGPNVLGMYDVQTIGGYTPLITADYRAFFKAIDAEVDIWWMRSPNKLVMSHFNPMVSLLNVKYILSTQALPFEIIPQAAVEGCSQTAVISPSLLTQSFTATDAGLNRIDVTFATTADDGDMNFWLWRDVEGGELVAHLTVPTNEIVAKQSHPFFFLPVADAANQTFVWGVNSVESETAVSLCQNEAGDYAFAAYANWLQHRETANGVWIYENPNVAPRAFLVHHMEQRPEDEVLARLHSDAFNWNHSVIMNEPLPEVQQTQLSDVPVRTASNVVVTNYESQQVDIHVDTPAAGMLVLGDSFYPGWEATVDGEETTVYQVDHTLRGVFVPAGTHNIQFKFRPKTVQTAVVISSISLLIAILLITGSVWRKNNINR